MRYVSLQRLNQGARLARPLLDEKGVILLGAGAELTPFIIQRLTALGIPAVYIEDGRTEDAVPDDVISQETRQQALSTIHTTMREMTVAEKFPRQFQQQEVGRRIRDLFDVILGEMRSKKGMAINLANIYTTDGFLYHHSLNVSIMSVAMGLEYGLNEKQSLDLGVGTLLHDVGKLRVPQEILNKPGRLTDEEFQAIQHHALYGYEMLRAQDDISAMSAHVALQHHERIDGTGYPRGLKGDEIHIFGKISAVADVYEALTANRIYRKGHLPHHALEFLLGACGSHFETEMVQIFLKTISIYPVGMTVQLNTGETGVVVAHHIGHPQRPTVRVLQTPDGEELKQPYDVNLMENLTVMIVSCEG
ncbi:HD-GYP domain-containing protein [Tumebacillus sp. DT12]|uniref:HD-GYP domain-containing protein n=1 Tax=Tumebacillus lacus TaxID=2995335 RepID=A0ABT3WY83_9BACL|nr:HD-GYP domain-containing protein [Tumebacillus lacus]MCX7569596.1 HD-GYP domain-containing protein [Tumebacillus lacus]